jgi:hypothetical protein
VLWHFVRVSDIHSGDDEEAGLQSRVLDCVENIQHRFVFDFFRSLLTGPVTRPCSEINDIGLGGVKEVRKFRLSMFVFEGQDDGRRACFDNVFDLVFRVASNDGG